MTVKPKKTNKKKAGSRTSRSRSGRIARLRASADGDLLRLAKEDAGAESRWNRPRKQRISLRVDCEVVDWFKSLGPGYTTRINRILRKVMAEGKKRRGQK